MCRRNIRESLTARIFLLTLLLLLGAGGLTFGLIAWATPITYVSVVGDRLQVQVSELTDRLALTKLADAGPILDVFVRESGAAVSLASPDGESVDTGSLYVSVTTAVQESDSVSTYTYGADGGPAQRERAGHYVTTALSDALIAEVTFADRADMWERIDRRVDEMMERGLAQEVRSLLDSGVPEKCTAMQAIGYKEMAAALRGDGDVDRAAREIQLRSRQYAKRQLTWFRRNGAAKWITWDSEPNFAQALQVSTGYLEDFGI